MADFGAESNRFTWQRESLGFIKVTRNLLDCVKSNFHTDWKFRTIIIFTIVV